ncbi:hypothetical protein LX36DRAFT_261237 [Colletotrichum falcatum]|nr:hypothetical protein LX36DRAFT_261237 [Colletotrichum falcatum]
MAKHSAFGLNRKRPRHDALLGAARPCHSARALVSLSAVHCHRSSVRIDADMPMLIPPVEQFGTLRQSAVLDAERRWRDKRPLEQMGRMTGLDGLTPRLRCRRICSIQREGKDLYSAGVLSASLAWYTLGGMLIRSFSTETVQRHTNYMDS